MHAVLCSHSPDNSTSPAELNYSGSKSSSPTAPATSLRLSYLFENAVPAAEQAARDGHGHLHYLQELIAGEVALRHDRSVQRRIHDARFPVVKTMAGWDWNWPAKINRMQVEHLLELDFINTNVVFAGPTGIGKTHLAIALGYLPLDKRGAELLFQVITKSGEHSIRVKAAPKPFVQNKAEYNEI